MEYLERVADIELKERLDAIGAVYIKGPKWCGKSTTAGQQAKSTIWLQDPDKRAEYLATGMTTPSVLLRGQYAYRRKDGVYVIPLACLKD